jgi:hypothetical protein
LNIRLLPKNHLNNLDIIHGNVYNTDGGLGGKRGLLKADRFYRDMDTR